MIYALQPNYAARWYTLSNDKHDRNPQKQSCEISTLLTPPCEYYCNWHLYALPSTSAL